MRKLKRPDYPKPRLHIFMRKPRVGEYSIERLFAALGSEMSVDYDLRILTSPFSSSGFVPRVLTILWAAMHQGEINHISGDIHFASLMLNRRRTVLTIHDSASLKRLTGLKRWLYEVFWIRLPIHCSTYVTVISHQTAREIALMAGDRPVHVVPNCALLSSGTSTASGDLPIILQVGTRENKNLETVATALNGVKCVLRIVGELSGRQREVLTENRISYEHFKDLDDAAIRELYLSSSVLVFASFYEGFGLPILEAQAVGLPVVTSSLEPMLEVAGNGAVFVDPHDHVSIRKAVVGLLTDPCMRRQLIKVGRENAKRFLPAIVADRYKEIYRKILIQS